MTTVDTSEAEIHLTQLLDRVAEGERITITGRGETVAMLVLPEPSGAADVGQPVRDLLAWRDGLGPALGADPTVRDLVAAGRRR